ncbi:MAG: hypothetical protein RJA36_1818 [Pseudomonadota bacterium]|jgi:hypothetical protein
MPYEIIREPHGVYKRFWGVVTPGEFLASVRGFHSDPQFEHIRYTINDFSATESFAMGEGAIEDTAAINIGASYVNSRYRILAVTEDPVIIGMARKYDAVSDMPPILVFPTLLDARQWLSASG